MLLVVKQTSNKTHIRYLQHFHPFLPILRKKEPDDCYDAQPVLFWAILYVTCRRYAKDTQLFSALVEHMTKNLWPMMSSAVLGLDEIHAILLVCAWPYPTIRFVTDPSSMLVNIAMNACMSLGLHTGRGSHPQFCVGSRHGYTSTDEEASSTWIACCLLAQRFVYSYPFASHFVIARYTSNAPRIHQDISKRRPSSPIHAAQRCAV